jgi:hypothetical protein
MLASISPLGERARGQHWWTTASWYFVASVLGGATTGAVAGGAGRLIRVAFTPSDGAVMILIAVVCLVGAILDLSHRRVVLPTIHRQVNEDWLVRFRGWVYGGAFGYQLGLGVVTIVTTAAVYVLIAMAVLVGSIITGLVLGAVFGAARALPLMTMALVREPGELRAAHRRLQSWAVPAHTFTVSVLAVATVASGVLAGRELSWLG